MVTKRSHKKEVFEQEEAKFYKEGAGTRKEKTSFRKGIPGYWYSIINTVSLYLNLYFVNNDSRTKSYVLATILFHLCDTFSCRVFFLHPLKPLKILGLFLYFLGVLKGNGLIKLINKLYTCTFHLPYPAG